MGDLSLILLGFLLFLVIVEVFLYVCEFSKDNVRIILIVKFIIFERCCVRVDIDGSELY